MFVCRPVPEDRLTIDQILAHPFMTTQGGDEGAAQRGGGDEQDGKMET